MVLTMDRWVGKTAVVTGASAGIGVAIVEKLVEAGLEVVGIARRVERVEDLAKMLANRKGKLHPLKADVSKEDDILNAFKWIKENLGAVHILINNAGVYHHTSLIEGETSEWISTFDVNVMGLCIATREAIKDMKENKVDGHIIHINSVAGHTITGPRSNVYGASKYAVTALTETLRQELNSIGSKIKITSVSPGMVVSELRIANRGEGESLIDENVPMLAEEDIADAVVYVLSTPPHVQVHELTIKPVNEAF